MLGIPKKQTREWILKKHYAHRLPQVLYAFGLYKDKKLVGICTFGKPPSPNLCTGICGKEHTDLVFELNRLVINDGLPKNSASYFVSRCIRLLPKPMIIVSFADPSKNHHGYVYQACNFLYTGLSDGHKDWKIKGQDSHPKKAARIQTLDKREVSDQFYTISRVRKHRYIYFSGNKIDVKNLKSKLRYKVEAYPKGDNEKYDSSHDVTVQLRLE